MIGSQAFGAFVRTALVAAKQEDDEGRVLARAKSNIFIDDGGVTYFIEEYTARQRYPDHPRYVGRYARQTGCLIAVLSLVERHVSRLFKHPHPAILGCIHEAAAAARPKANLRRVLEFAKRS